jgi:hypothetical protein
MVRTRDFAGVWREDYIHDAFSLPFLFFCRLGPCYWVCVTVILHSVFCIFDVFS